MSKRSAGGLTAVWKNDTWVRPYFGRYRKVLLLSLALGLLTLVCAVALMFMSGYLISSAASQPDRGLFELLIPIGLVQIFGFGKPFSGYFERLTSHDWVLRMTSSLRRRLYVVVEEDGMFWAATHKAGDALGLLTQDIGHVQNLYLRTVFPLLTAWILGGVMVLALGLMSWPCAVMLLIGFVVMAVLLPFVALLVSGAKQAAVKQKRAELYAAAYDNVAGVADWVYAGRGEEYVSRVTQVGQQLDALEAQMAASSRRRGLVLQVVFAVCAVGLLLWAGSTYGAAAETANWIAAFVLGFFPLLEAFQPLPDAAVEAVGHADSVARLNAVDEGAGAHAGEAGNLERSGNVENIPAAVGFSLRNVTFAFEDAAPVVDGLSLNIPAGQKVAVLGPSGSGKSTLAHLLRGDYQPTAGLVLLDGADAHQLNREGRMPSYVGFMQQSSYLFAQSLFGNVKIGNPKITREQAEQALRDVGLGPLLDRLPQGLDTQVDEAGLRFSGGERHRIALARLLVQQAPVVVLDEPTVSLDPLTESQLLATVFEIFADRTVVLITHHLQGVAAMDRVIFLEEGRVVLDGAPTTLADTNERYQQLLAFDRGESA
ncbi:MAG: thiol reductant ABC exporter subunit CydC [Coriobacteriia bacterium]|nr:thiol reductant ABC exporter subunit CydC [Coriobacteriia bacterium]